MMKLRSMPSFLFKHIAMKFLCLCFYPLKHLLIGLAKFYSPAFYLFGDPVKKFFCLCLCLSKQPYRSKAAANPRSHARKHFGPTQATAMLALGEALVTQYIIGDVHMRAITVLQGALVFLVFLATVSNVHFDEGVCRYISAIVTCLLTIKPGSSNLRHLLTSALTCCAYHLPAFPLPEPRPSSIDQSQLSYVEDEGDAHIPPPLPGDRWGGEAPLGCGIVANDCRWHGYSGRHIISSPPSRASTNASSSA